MSAQSPSQSFAEMLDGLLRHTVPQLDPATLPDEVVAYRLLDARARAEYEVSHLPGAQWVGYEAFDPEQLAALPRDEPLLVYCSVGYRSERIGERLLAMGFEQVYNLYGGIFEWVHAGHPVIDAQGAPTERVHTYDAKWSQWLQRGEKVY